MPARSREYGFSLPELLVAMIILAIVVSQALLAFTTQHRLYVGQGRVLDIQQDARLVMEMMVGDVRMAGFLVPEENAITGIDGGAAGPDILCVSDPAVMADAEVDAAKSAFEAATLQANLGAAASQVTLTAAEMDIDGDGDNDFAIGAGIILSDGTTHHCARITGFPGTAVQFTPITPAGFVLAAGTGVAVPAVIYEIAAGGLRRNNSLLSAQVENLQIEYAVDLDDDGSIGAGEFPVHVVTGTDPTLIRGVQISVLTRTSMEDPANRGSWMPAAGNHNAGAPDSFLRRRFTASAVPRNLR